jgi:ABC-type multidrug transport system ATPase subunit
VTNPTHGNVYLNGLNVEDDAAEVQQIIGVCPQDDILWDELTAKEHMILTAAFKGLAFGIVLYEAVDSVLSMVRKGTKMQKMAKNPIHSFKFYLFLFFIYM